MATLFPGSLDTFTTKVDGTSDVLAADTNNLQDAVSALQAKVGVNGSGNTSSLDYKASTAFSRELPLGMGQTWQSVSRASGTWYQNTTGRAIMINVTWNSGGSALLRVGVSTTTYVTISQDTGDPGTSRSLTTVIPKDHWYFAPAGGITSAMELR